MCMSFLIILVSTKGKQEGATKLETYYLGLHIPILKVLLMLFLSSKVVCVLYCPNNQFDLCFWKMRHTIHTYGIVKLQIVSDTKYRI